MQITRLPDGIELYFPPFRAPAAAVSLALFGIACLISGLFAAFAVAPLSASGAGGMVAIWLMASFIVPFIVFGVLFLALAAWRLASSLKVVVTSSHVLTRRCVLGFNLRERCVGRADILALEAVPSRLYRWPRSEIAFYDLVMTMKSAARTAAEATSGAPLSGRAGVTVAENVNGEDLETIRAKITAAAGLDQPM